MRRSVAATVAMCAAIAITLLSGCSSGGTAATPSASQVISAALAPAANPAASGASNQLSTPPITDPRPFPAVTELTAPPAVLDALKGKRAFFLVYYDPTQSVTVDQKNVVYALQKKYAGLIEFISYDLPATTAASTDAEKKTAQQVAELAQRLSIGYMPTIVIVTKDGIITWQSTGYYDAGPLEREILRATR